jgi:SNF2 family DNA or RNA helicase
MFSVDMFSATELILVPDAYDPVEHSKFQGFTERKWANNSDYKGWIVPCNPKSVEYLNSVWRENADFTLSESARMMIMFETLTNKVNAKKSIKRWEYLFDDKITDFCYPSNRRPFDHQRVAVEAMYGAEYFGLLMEMGTGKTKCIVDELKLYQIKMNEQKEMLRCIIGCPKALMVNWKRELESELNTCGDCVIEILNKGDFKAIEQVYSCMKSKASTKVLIVSYDSFATLLKILLAFKPVYLCCDESHYLKNGESQRWRAVNEVAKNTSIRRILTGTPVSNNILDVFSQFQLLRPGCLGFNTYNAFKREYAEVESTGQFEKITGFKNVERLKENMAAISFIVKKDRCLDLPAKMYETVAIEMPANVRDIYEEFSNNFYVALAGTDQEVTTEYIIVQMLKLCQICSGYVVSQDMNTTETTIDADGNIVPKVITNLTEIPGGDYKLEQMLDDIEEAVPEGKVIVWARFNHDILRIVERLKARGIRGCPFYGATSGKERQQYIDDFNGESDLDVFVANAGAGGVGLTLLGPASKTVKTVYYYNNDFSYGKRNQSEDRCHRIGLKNPILYKDYCYANSIEEYIATKLQQKKDLSDAVKNVGEIKELLLANRG